MRLIRLDDYPYGHPTAFEREWCYPRISGICRILNAHGIPFILGVVPFELTAHDVAILKTILAPHGKAVMHGFTHGFDFPKLIWGNISETWKDGGEFIGMSEEQIKRRYVMADIIMRGQLGDLYDREHFICPFNTYTLELWSVLPWKGVRYLHTADEEHALCGPYYDYDFGGCNMKMVVSEHNKTYDWVDSVINHLDNPSQITLHWSFDCQKYPTSWWDKYEQFAEALVKHEDTARVC